MPLSSSRQSPFSATLAGTVDELGDTFGASAAVLDIARFDAVVSTNAVTFVVEFHNPISAPSAFAFNSTVGFIDIDLDQDFLTSSRRQEERIQPDWGQSLGRRASRRLVQRAISPRPDRDRRLDSVMQVGMASVTYDDSAFSVEVPLDLLKGDSSFNYGLIIGDYLDMSDEAPNDGFESTVPEPSGAMLALAACLSTATSASEPRLALKVDA